MSERYSLMPFQKENMMLTFTAHSDGKVIVPDEPVDLPADAPFRVQIELVDDETGPVASRPLWLEKALELSKKMPKGLPRDLAEQHDHYLYGTPKR